MRHCQFQPQTAAQGHERKVQQVMPLRAMAESLQSCQYCRQVCTETCCMACYSYFDAILLLDSWSSFTLNSESGQPTTRVGKAHSTSFLHLLHMSESRCADQTVFPCCTCFLSERSIAA